MKSELDTTLYLSKITFENGRVIYLETEELIALYKAIKERMEA
jgi:hypothetical protein